jgi:hypothetical protein
LSDVNICFWRVANKTCGGMNAKNIIKHG